MVEIIAHTCLHINVIVAYMYVEYDNVEELKAQFDHASIKVLEDFFKKCWTKEYLQNPLVLVLHKPVCISSHIYTNIIVSLLYRY